MITPIEKIMLSLQKTTKTTEDKIKDLERRLAKMVEEFKKANKATRKYVDMEIQKLQKQTKSTR